MPDRRAREVAGREVGLREGRKRIAFAIARDDVLRVVDACARAGADGILLAAGAGHADPRSIRDQASSTPRFAAMH